MLFSSKIRCQEEITISNTVYHYTLTPLVSHSTSGLDLGCSTALTTHTPLTNSHPSLSRLERLRAQFWEEISQLPMLDRAALSGACFELSNTDLYKICP